MAKLTFFQNYSNKNVVNKELVHYTYGNNNIVPCQIVYPCSLESPIFELGSTYFDNRKCNYLYCDILQRYYFIDDVELMNNGIVRLHCSVDVLKSFETDIRGIYTVIERQESKTNCNPYIPDTQIVGRIDRHIQKYNVGQVGGNATGTHIVLTTTGGVL